MVVINGDTLVAFSQEQSDDLLQIYLHREKLVQETTIKDSLLAVRDRHISQQDSSLTYLQDLLLTSQKNADSYLEIINNKDSEISLRSKQFKRRQLNNTLKV